METRRSGERRASGRLETRDRSTGPERSSPTPPHAVGTREETISREILRLLFGPAESRGFEVRLWSGRREPGCADPPFTIVLRHPAALRRMFHPPTERRMGEAYLRADFEVEGDLEAATLLVGRIREAFGTPRRALRLASLLRSLPSGSGSARSDRRPHRPRGPFRSSREEADAVRYHYDVGNDFYRLWLDDRMVYSCGYFPDSETNLEEAQEAKLELVCRKLRLRRGDRLLDIGCGWGSLVMHAAERHGAECLGVTLSEAQARLARERIEAAGLTDRCRVEVMDYRDLPEGSSFDKIASIGMVEHVGRRELGGYFRRAHRMLAPGGLFLNHGIVTLEPAPSALRRAMRTAVRRRTSFMENWVFPGGELVAYSELAGPAERAGFELRDVENLREHYARTLRCWLRRLEAARGTAIELVGEATYRVWRLYMAASAGRFATGEVAVVQTLLARPDERGAVAVPSTRADLYRT